jgi:branched-chain amino acid transport system ATP-binding protein
MSGGPLLVGAGLTKRYGGIVAVRDVALRVHAGEVLGLVGPNGAGKTTLVDLITGAQSSDGGTLTLNGRPLRGPAAARAAHGLARTFQHPQLAAELSVRDNLALGRIAARHRTVRALIAGMVRGVLRPGDAGDGAAVGQIAAELGLSGLTRPAGDLTLGEQRLVEVGRALGADPLVLLLDEPFAGADAAGVAGVSAVIRLLRQRGHGVILVDHNVDLVADLVDRLMLLDSGQVAFDGEPAECLRSHEMQRVYFGAVEPEPAARPEVSA